MDVALLERTAMIRGTQPIDKIDWLAPCWDARDDDAAIDVEAGEVVDEHETMRETSKGIQAKLHPIALLASEPLLWGTVSRWNAGQRELTLDDYDRLSAFELKAKTAMVAAANRALRRPD